MSQDFIANLTDFEYRGLWYGNDDIYRRFMSKIFKNVRNIFTTQSISHARRHSIGEFSEHVKEYCNNLFFNRAIVGAAKSVCIEENMSSMFADDIFLINDDIKIIHVIRDPMDVYMDSLRVGWMAIPLDFESFILWQKSVISGWLYKYRQYEEAGLLGSNYIVIKYEDMISSYDDTLQKITDYLELRSEEHETPKKYFNPKISDKYYQQWKGKLPQTKIDRFMHEFNEYYSKFYC
jgi:hypothetical protein